MQIKILSSLLLHGASSVDIQDSKELGFSLSKSVSDKFSLYGGLNYSISKVDVSFVFSGRPCLNGTLLAFDPNPDFKMLSVLVYAECVLRKYFYAAAGRIPDFQLAGRNNFTDHSGIGFLMGAWIKSKNG